MADKEDVGFVRRRTSTAGPSAVEIGSGVVQGRKIIWTPPSGLNTALAANLKQAIAAANKMIADGDLVVVKGQVAINPGGKWEWRVP